MGRATLAKDCDTLAVMSPPLSRVEITLDREAVGFRALFDAVAAFRRSARPDEATLLATADVPTRRSPGVESERPRISQPVDAPARGPWLDDAPSTSIRPRPISKAGAYLARLRDAYGPLAASVLADEAPFVDTLVLDASALTALAGGDMRVRAHVASAVGSLARICVPATSLHDPVLERIATSCAEIVPIDREHARLAATLLVRVPGSDPFDALAVALAARADRGAIVTMRAKDLDPLRVAANRQALFLFSA